MNYFCYKHEGGHTAFLLTKFPTSGSQMKSDIIRDFIRDLNGKRIENNSIVVCFTCKEKLPENLSTSNIEETKMTYEKEIEMIEHHGIQYTRIDHPRYKYKLSFRYEMYSGLSTPYEAVGNQFVYLEPNGKLVIKMGYAWDGPSGPTIDTQDFMRGSLIHDAFYQMLRMGAFYTKVNHDIVRKHADHLLYEACREDGMSWFRAKYVYHMLRVFAGKAANHDYGSFGQPPATKRVKLKRGTGPISKEKSKELHIPPTLGRNG